MFSSNLIAEGNPTSRKLRVPSYSDLLNIQHEQPDRQLRFFRDLKKLLFLFDPQANITVQVKKACCWQQAFKLNSTLALFNFSYRALSILSEATSAIHIIAFLQ